VERLFYGADAEDQQPDEEEQDEVALLEKQAAE
jgi:hypothetical protein